MGTASFLASLGTVLALAATPVQPKHRRGEGLIPPRKNAASPLTAGTGGTPQSLKPDLPARLKASSATKKVVSPADVTEDAGSSCLAAIPLVKLFDLSSDTQPVAAADGVFFLRIQEGKKRIYYQRQTATSAVALAEVENPEKIQAPPDGKKLLVLSGSSPLYSLKALVQNQGKWNEISPPGPPFLVSNAVWSPSGEWIAYTAWRKDSDFELRRWDTDTGKDSLLASLNGFHVISGISPDDKKIVLLRAQSRHSGEWYLWKAGGTPLEKIGAQANPQESAAVFTQNSRGLFLLAASGKGTTQVFFTSIPAKRSPKPVTFETGTVEHLAADRKQTKLVYVVNEGGYSRFGGWEISGAGTLGRKLSLPAQRGVTLDTPAIVSGPDATGSHLFFSRSTSRQPSQIWRWSGNKESVWGQSSSAPLAQGCFSQESDVLYPSFDQTPIHGFLFRPRTVSSSPRFIVLAHSGPDSQYRPAFDPQVQYLVQRGFSVLAPNVRGSTGYGQAFEMADNGTLRVNAARDLAQASHWLTQEKLSRSGKTGVFGVGNGGWLAEKASELDSGAFGATAMSDTPPDFSAFLANLPTIAKRLWEPEFGPSVFTQKPVRSILSLFALSPLESTRLVTEHFEKKLH